MNKEIAVGARVISSDDQELGRVKQIEKSAFLVDAPRQFDYWLEVTHVATATADAVTLTIAQADLGSYKMDRPHDHNEFRAPTPNHLKPNQVRDSVMGNQRTGL